MTHNWSDPIGPVHALFQQQRIAADDALLRLAQLRFAQMGVAAELYADTPDELEHVLRFAPAEPRLPVVHLNRDIDLLQEPGRRAVRDFAGRFTGRITGLNVHDRRGMADLDAGWLRAMAELDAFLDKEAPDVTLFLEYAAHLEPGRFTGMIGGLKDLAHVSCCIDVGHLGIRQAGAQFARRHPGLALTELGVADERLPRLVADVQDAVGGALGDVQDVIRAVGKLGKPVHFHLHDGHPLVPGLSDHFSFLTRLAIPFSYEGRRSLRMLYGPAGLAAIVSTAARACRPVSFTVEVHQVEGRLPLGDAAYLFPDGQDDAERMNYWLNVLSENAMLISQNIAGLPEPPAAADGRNLALTGGTAAQWLMHVNRVAWVVVVLGALVALSAILAGVFGGHAILLAMGSTGFTIAATGGALKLQARKNARALALRQDEVRQRQEAKRSLDKRRLDPDCADVVRRARAAARTILDSDANAEDLIDPPVDENLLNGNVQAIEATAREITDVRAEHRSIIAASSVTPEVPSSIVGTGQQGLPKRPGPMTAAVIKPQQDYLAMVLSSASGTRRPSLTWPGARCALSARHLPRPWTGSSRTTTPSRPVSCCATSTSSPATSRT